MILMTISRVRLEWRWGEDSSVTLSIICVLPQAMWAGCCFQRSCCYYGLALAFLWGQTAWVTFFRRAWKKPFFAFCVSQGRTECIYGYISKPIFCMIHVIQKSISYKKLVLNCGKLKVSIKTTTKKRFNSWPSSSTKMINNWKASLLLGPL